MGGIFRCWLCFVRRRQTPSSKATCRAPFFVGRRWIVLDVRKMGGGIIPGSFSSDIAGFSRYRPFLSSDVAESESRLRNMVTRSILACLNAIFSPATSDERTGHLFHSDDGVLGRRYSIIYRDGRGPVQSLAFKSLSAREVRDIYVGHELALKKSSSLILLRLL